MSRLTWPDIDDDPEPRVCSYPEGPCVCGMCADLDQFVVPLHRTPTRNLVVIGVVALTMWLGIAIAVSVVARACINV